MRRNEQNEQNILKKNIWRAGEKHKIWKDFNSEIFIYKFFLFRLFLSVLTKWKQNENVFQFFLYLFSF